MHNELQNQPQQNHGPYTPLYVQTMFAHYKQRCQQARTTEERTLLRTHLAYYQHLMQTKFN